jgi:large subunit ribosomal protein L4
MELAVYNIEGKETGKVKVSDEIFGRVPNEHVVYLDVKQYLANQRQGTHSAKEKSQLSGSTRKLHKQKGTGGSRKGSIKNPLFKGGARVFGPRPRSYGFKLNRKVKQLARISALSSKVKEGNITVVDNISFETIKTKNTLGFINNFKFVGKKILFVVPESNKNVYLSSRNLKGVSVITASDLNTYDILKAEKVVLDQASIVKIENLLLNK